VPVVVASLWSVESDSTSTLMIAFHKYRRSTGHSTAEALQQAQVQMLKTARFSHPYYWASFAVIGGYATF
jgi:CHAT domain-containing protein